MEEFVEAWTSDVRPLREKFGFRVEGAWVSADGTRFVWIVSHRSAELFLQAEREYYASPERIAMDDPAVHLAEIRTLEMHPA